MHSLEKRLRSDLGPHTEPTPMKHDIFEFAGHDMKPWERTWRVLFLAGVIATVLLDLMVWRP